MFTAQDDRPRRRDALLRRRVDHRSLPDEPPRRGAGRLREGAARRRDARGRLDRGVRFANARAAGVGDRALRGRRAVRGAALSPAAATPAGRPPSGADRRGHARDARAPVPDGRRHAHAGARAAIEADDPKAAAKREVEEALRAEPDHVTAGAIAHFMLKAPSISLRRRRPPGRTPATGWPGCARGRVSTERQSGWRNDAVARAAARRQRRSVRPASASRRRTKLTRRAYAQRAANSRWTAASSPSRPGL